MPILNAESDPLVYCSCSLLHCLFVELRNIVQNYDPGMIWLVLQYCFVTMYMYYQPIPRPPK